MGSVSEMGRKLTIVSMRICYKSICNHPFIFGMLLFMIFLNRSFPFLFSLLVSASPVLISTALLLGTLLSFGQPNVPEIELEEKLNSDVVASLKSGISANNCAFIVEKDETFSMERYVAVKSIGKTSSEDNKASNEEDRDVPVGYVPLLDDDLQEIQTQKKVIEVVGREFRNMELEKEKESQKSELRSESAPNNGEAVENHYGYDQEIRDEIFSMRVSESFGESVEAHKQEQFNYSAVGGEDNDDEDEFVDSGSDRAESSSPDASISDIIPMLDELHPLLDEEAPRTTQLLPDDSDVASEHSHRSSDGSEELDENMENQREAGVDNDDDDEAHGGKEDESKSAIKWTEDDEKNLMDLGTLELERNQRLESLIVRRRARKSFKLMAERNLIDLESSEILFNVPPISVTRQNPFDLPFDSYDIMGLPPIPGSAPSVLLARRNPFDIPYEPNEEKPDLKGDDFEQEFSTVHQRDMVPKRYESFSTGPSSLADSRQERQDFKWRPVFVPEGFASEGASCSSFHRQSSEVSDSKLSSVPDTDLVSSDSDLDEKKPNEPDHSKEIDLASNVSDPGSQSSEELDTLELMQAEKGNVQNDETEIILGGVENHSEMELNFSVTGKVATATNLELSSRETHFMAGPAEGEESSGPSLSLLSEVGEKSNDVQKRDASTSVEVKVDDIDQSSLSVQPSLEEPEVQSVSEVVDDSQHKEPVYDTSPPSDEKEKLISFSSISSTTEEESSRIVTPITSEEMVVMVDKQESELYSVSAEQNSSVYHEISTKAQATDGFGVRSIDDSEIIVVDGLKFDNKPTFEPCFDDHGILHEQADFHVLGTKSSSTSGFRTIPSEGVELDLKDGILDAIVKENNSQVTETYHPEGKVALESINEEVNESTEIDEGFLSELDTVGDFSLKEVGGESLATELTVEEANLGSEKIELSTIDSNPTDKKLVLPVLESRSIEDITMAFKQLDEGTDANEGILTSLIKNHQHNEESKDTHIATSNLQEVEARSLEDVHKASQQVLNDHVSDLPVLDARSIEDVEVALKQFHEGTDVNEVILPILSNDLLLGEESEDNHIATSNLVEVEARCLEDIQKTLKQVSNDDVSDLLVLEARSMEDIDVAFKKIHEETDANDAILPSLIKDQLLKEESKDTHMDDLKEVEVRYLEDNDKALQQVSHDHVSDLPVLEARSMEDIDVAFKQLDEGIDVNQVILPSLIKDQLLIEESKDSRIFTSNLPEVEARSSEDIQKALKQVSNDHVSDLPVLEARSMEDIDVAFKQLDEGTDANEIILPSLIKDQLLKEKLEDTRIATSNLLEVEARSSEDSQKALKQVSNDNVSDLPVLEARSMEDIDVAFKQLDEETDLSEIILPSLIKGKLLQEEPKDTHIARSNLREVEARSLEDIHKALQQLSNDHVSDIPVLEARSIEDIDVALKQFHEGKDLNFVEEQYKDGQIANSDMQDVEAKSLQDIIALKIEEPLEVTSVEERSEITSNELEGLHETLEISKSSTLNSTDKEEVNASISNSDFSNINSSSSDSIR